ncbi:Serine/threonine-protein kinase [Chondrus crispus]|uniref:Serine/threonine-protein kinase n=1 Tax=Chondrus crispus TaxID=2769 RepID=R7Q7D1_CHOCR|nr:Serine/threonine-protein kinase [Chondrus crispus]CDF34432.1 Serine/threonine-protein kinase [Chondrus crispus]|eukprot:XP_005714251.1 Serine/threonine-protein kinase [Chondrus crispus]
MATSSNPRPEMRYGKYTEKEGYLPKKASILRSNPIFGVHKKYRYLVVRGSNLKCFRQKEDTRPEWELALQNTEVLAHPDKLEIEIRTWAGSEEFAADSEEQYNDWYETLRYASERNIKHYYVFVRAIGEGHFGKVVMAKDRRTKEKFAVKVIKKESKEQRSKTLIQRELNILRLVNHPNVVRLFDLFDAEDRLYFVLEYMAGGALYEVLSSKTIHFSEESASVIIKDILLGLAYLHEKGIVHRDVKPENILTTAKTWPFTSKLADFGLSNFLESGVLESKVGTPYFCAREVVTSETYGTKADLWSLGVVAYEMLSGRKPFEGSHTQSVLHTIQRGKYSFPKTQWQYISDEAIDFISKLICIDVNRRLSAVEALQHPWIVNEGRNEALPNALPHALTQPKPTPKPAEYDDDMDDM